MENLAGDGWLKMVNPAPFAPLRPGNYSDALQPRLIPEDTIDETR